MKTIQCAHTPHHHNSFVAICRLWTASDFHVPQTTLFSHSSKCFYKLVLMTENFEGSKRRKDEKAGTRLKLSKLKLIGELYLAAF